MESNRGKNGKERSHEHEKMTVPMEVQYSPEHEFVVLRWRVRNHKWFIENGYEPALPTEILEKLERGESVSDNDISAAVIGEYQVDLFRAKENEFKEIWEAKAPYFFERLRELGRPLPPKYIVRFSRYGNGGSFYPPNFITLCIGPYFDFKVYYTTFHEIVHLTIDDLIEKYNIPHWTKERLVDLIMTEFFPDTKQLQRDPEQAELILEIFEREFPDIEKIVREVAQVKSE
jgi:hypothetical protein